MNVIFLRTAFSGTVQQACVSQEKTGSSMQMQVELLACDLLNRLERTACSAVRDAQCGRCWDC